MTSSAFAVAYFPPPPVENPRFRRRADRLPARAIRP